MGLLSGLLTLPLAPVRGVVWLAEQIEEEAERQWSDPAAIRQQLAELDRAHEEGLLSDDERDQRADALVARLVASRSVRQPPAAEGVAGG
jgi:hypothetical protein